MGRFRESGKRKTNWKKQKNSKDMAWLPDFSGCGMDWAIGAACTACAAFLCYRSVFGLLSGFLIIPVCIRIRKADRKEKREQDLTKQFCDAMQAVSASLRTGSSMEQAFKEAERETVRLYGTQSEFVTGLSKVNRHVQMNEPLEELFLAFAYQTQAMEIISFAESFHYAKRSGADMPHMIRTVVERIREKEMILENIRTMVSAKRLEQRLLLLLVPGVLLFVTVSSPEYAGTLYHSLPGILLMTGCLLGYLIAAWWGRRIVSIRV